MIKLVIMDLDGVIFNTEEIHYNALNEAIAKYSPQHLISRELDSGLLGAITSKMKLQFLSEKYNLPVHLHSRILEKKSQIVDRMISKLPLEEYFDSTFIDIIDHIKSLGILVYIASNASPHFVYKLLEKSGLNDDIDAVFHNGCINKPKPHPEIYYKCMIEAGVLPSETLILEDSYTGIQAAHNSGAYVYQVVYKNNVSLEKLLNKINSIDTYQPPWISQDLNVVIPMAGLGSRFANVGYKLPKPLIDVNGMPMIKRVVDSINIDANYIYIVQREHYEKFNLQTMLNLITPNCKIVLADGLNGGAVPHVLLSEEYINNDNPMVIINSDQIWDWSPGNFCYKMLRENLDGGIVVFKDEERDPKWSFAKIDDYGYVTEVAEKIAISEWATAGIYYWGKGSDFVKDSKEMMNRNIRVNNEFYVCPVYNMGIERGLKIKTFECDKMIGIGTPSDLEKYLNGN